MVNNYKEIVIHGHSETVIHKNSASAIQPCWLRSYWQLIAPARERETEIVFFTGMASGRSTRLQRKATHLRIYGQDKLDLVAVVV